jgi:hypothetical protein
MFPLIAIGGAISAVVSVVHGTSWLSGKLGMAKSAAAAGPTATANPQTNALSSRFEAALAAQATGQTLPGSTIGGAAKSPTLPAMTPLIHGTDYDSLARMNAGMAAYSQIGEHHGNRAGVTRAPGADDDKPVTQS